MKVTDQKYFQEYFLKKGNQIDSLIMQFDFSECNGSFDYLTKASAVFSSNIEGNTIDLNSFMNYKLNKEKFNDNKEIKEIENLISAYNFAGNNSLTEKNILICHKLLSETLLIKSKRGKYRVEPVGVFGKKGLVYLSVEPEFVEQLMTDFFRDINSLVSSNLTQEKIFYFAALIHLVFVHIHPFKDGNGRVARLLEKWFIVENLGKKFWKIPSEKFYKINQQKYYESINLGVNYYELNYDGCVDFLTLLPDCLKL